MKSPIARFRGFTCSKKFRRFRDNLVNFPRYQLSRLEGVSAIGPTATYCDSVEFSDPG